MASHSQDGPPSKSLESTATAQNLLHEILTHAKGRNSAKGITRVDLPNVFVEPDGDNCAFFYGTLMHPAVVRNVLRSDCLHLQMCPAIIYGHTRFQVKSASYPAVVPAEYVPIVVGESRLLTEEDVTVRGVLLKGLTLADIAKLDYFEGSSYSKERVSALPISPFRPMNSIPVKEVLSHSEALSSSAPDEATMVPAFVYIWTELLRYLKPDPWSYDTFVREKLKIWVDDSEPLEEDDESVLEGGEGTVADGSYIARGSASRRSP